VLETITSYTLTFFIVSSIYVYSCSRRHFPVLQIPVTQLNRRFTPTIARGLLCWLTQSC